MRESVSKDLSRAILPTFARFLQEHHLDELTREGIKIARESKLPILKYFQSISEEDFFRLSREGWQEVLTSLESGNQLELVTRSAQRWLDNQLQWLKKDDVVTEDITLISHVRKKTLLRFIPLFTQDIAAIIKLVEEIDAWQLEATSRLFKTFIQILQDRIDRQVKQLKESEALFKQAQAVTHIGNYVWDLDPPKLTWSDELYRIYGLDPATTQVTNEIAAKYNHPDDLKYIFEKIAKSKETLQPFDFYYRIILEDGTRKTLHARGETMVDENKVPVKIFGTAQDVTVQKEIEQKLEENSVFINKITDAAPAIIASYNIQNGQFAYVSKGLQSMLGYDPDEALQAGMPFFIDIIHPHDLGRILQENQQAQVDANSNGHAKEEPVAEFQYRMRHANGSYKWFRTFGTVLGRDHSGQVEHVLNISLDIDEKVKAEEVLLKRTIELQQSNSNLKEFAFVASHDLKEPLRKISTLGDRLLQTERENYSADGKVYLDKMITGAIRMQQMVDDLLALSQISNISHVERTDLDHLLADVMQTFEARMEILHAKIEADKLPVASIIPSQFRQLFQNLISNSLKFTRKGVPPLLTIKWDRPGANEAEELNLPPAPSYLRITFSDNGIGFDNKFSERIFAIFQRLHSKSEYEGTGIGLAICKKIVENHSGVMQATGRLGEGSVFTITIPTD